MRCLNFLSSPRRRAVIAATFAGSLVLAGTSQAAITGAAPLTGPASAEQIIALTGNAPASDFLNPNTGQLDVGHVQFWRAATTATCQATPRAADTAPNGANIYNATATALASATRLIVATPELMATGTATTTNYRVCVYNSANTALKGAVNYAVQARPTVTSLSVTGGPAAGGTPLTIRGANFTAASQVRIGGVLVPTTARRVISGSEILVTAVPARAPEQNVQVQVTTEGGPSLDTAADNYDVHNVVAVSPNAGPEGTVLTVTGVGFQTQVFTPDRPNAAVALTRAGIDTAELGTGQTEAGDIGGFCTNVLVLSDTELVCTVVDANDDMAGAYIVTVTANTNDVDGDPDTAGTGLPAYESVPSASAVFVASEF